MRIILSRKGFDSAAGGCPNPILPDGRLVPLPIPDSLSPIRYQDICHDEHNIGLLVNQLTKGKLTKSDGAHLDPDLVSTHYPRSHHWRPLLGQTGAAQGHLHKQGVSVGDIFLFFGVFQSIHRVFPNRRKHSTGTEKPTKQRQASGRKQWHFDTQQPKRHIIWGWMQVGQILQIDELGESDLPWARYHPHFYRGKDPNNTLYLASNKLNIPGEFPNLPGSGTFQYASKERILTAPDSLLTQWQLPTWWYPDSGKSPLSYHHNPERWKLFKDRVLLKAAARGQEFVLDCDDYPEALPWLAKLVQTELATSNPELSIKKALKE
ncbi:hypothetical protein BTA51_05085 [Hahella sp. CCB-MM4]|uniref:Nmad3 family putative nucleotide modification protein n=1 Tax=Hahella sp. (strain CCB-MM4) TaxID=1926491 RepID=UPI000B9B63F3|nr:hypothetical protein [Hahella sp. CCB-MM4]OZG74386.1 hypothetical protein BTA51_05085 [Hahella sp. CCB-MM4]